MRACTLAAITSFAVSFCGCGVALLTVDGMLCAPALARCGQFASTKESTRINQISFVECPRFMALAAVGARRVLSRPRERRVSGRSKAESLYRFLPALP